MNTKISCYTYLFNARLRSFDMAAAMFNFCHFFDEVVVATLPSQDDTLEQLKELQVAYPNLKVVETDIQLSDNRFDGKLKTAALKACSHPIRVIADCDERFPLTQKLVWQQYANRLSQSRFDGYLIPVVDLWGSRDLVRLNVNTGVKFRMHRDTIVKRDVLPVAELPNGLIDTSRSDTTEPITAEGKLGWFEPVHSLFQLSPQFVSSLRPMPYVIHEGYLDLQRRADLGRDFWEEHWKNRSGKDGNVETSVEKLSAEPTIAHNLALE